MGSFFFSFNSIEVQLICSVSISDVQQSDSVIHIYALFFYILFHYGLSQDIEQSSLCYTIGPCCLSILYIIVCIDGQLSINISVRLVKKLIGTSCNQDLMDLLRPHFCHWHQSLPSGSWLQQDDNLGQCFSKSVKNSRSKNPLTGSGSLGQGLGDLHLPIIPGDSYIQASLGELNYDQKFIRYCY